MSTNRRITLFHAPNSRSTGIVILLEELQADYQLHLLNMKANEQRGAAYLAINPMDWKAETTSWATKSRRRTCCGGLR
jgi:glutathione S-transferase